MKRVVICILVVAVAGTLAWTIGSARRRGEVARAAAESSRALAGLQIEAPALQTVSKERIWRELFMAMEEDDAPAVLAALTESGALEVLFGKREVRRSALEIVPRASATPRNSLAGAERSAETGSGAGWSPISQQSGHH